MANPNDLIREKIRLYDLEGLMKSVRGVQSEVFKESIDFYIAELNKLQEKGFVEKGSLAATVVNNFEKRLSDIVEKNSRYQSEIRNYYTSFDELDNLNLIIHKELNEINIEKIIKLANKQQRELIGTTAADIVSEKNIKVNLTGAKMREQFTKPVKKILYQGVMRGTPSTQLKTQLHDFIVGEKGKMGRLERWSGQITRDALSQYDGAVNDMVRKEYDLNAFRYIGSLVMDSRPQCVRWVTEKKGVLRYDELTKEIGWAYSNGKGMIPGTTKESFATYKGGYNCKHQAIPFRLENQPE